MCTVSVIPHSGASAAHSDEPRGSGCPDVLRIVCNRDEKRTRSEALPPVCRRFGDRTAILPIDPLSRGTWIGVNDAGLALCLLNASVRADHEAPAASRTRVLRSRGEVIPSLLHCETVGEAAARAARLDADEFPPFRLIAASRTHIGVISSDQSQVRIHQLRPQRGPFMATSSSLGDDLVDSVRRELFDQCLREHHDPSRAQQQFHAHQWSDRKHLSVLMSRPDARTVSRTVVEIARDSVRMTYCSLAEVHSTTSTPNSLTLERTAIGAMA